MFSGAFDLYRGRSRRRCIQTHAAILTDAGFMAVAFDDPKVALVVLSALRPGALAR